MKQVQVVVLFNPEGQTASRSRQPKVSTWYMKRFGFVLYASTTYYYCAVLLYCCRQSQYRTIAVRTMYIIFSSDHEKKQPIIKITMCQLVSVLLYEYVYVRCRRNCTYAYACCLRFPAPSVFIRITAMRRLVKIKVGTPCIP